MAASILSKQTDNESRALMRDGLIEFARADFMCFVELTFGVLHPGKNLIYADYLQLMANILMRVEVAIQTRPCQSATPAHEVDDDLSPIRCLASRSRSNDQICYDLIW